MISEGLDALKNMASDMNEVRLLKLQLLITHFTYSVHELMIHVTTL